MAEAPSSDYDLSESRAKVWGLNDDSRGTSNQHRTQMRKNDQVKK